MAGRSLRDDLEDGFNPEINTTPLVDVMLVLLVVFIITMPALQHAVKVELPRVSAEQVEAKPTSVDVAIDAGGVIHWNDKTVDIAALQQLSADAAQHDPQTEMHLRADRRTPYEDVMKVMSAAQHGGLSRIGFVSDENAR
jgi:biopolymer transport protein ExbD